MFACLVPTDARVGQRTDQIRIDEVLRRYGERAARLCEEIVCAGGGPARVEQTLETFRQELVRLLQGLEDEKMVKLRWSGDEQSQRETRLAVGPWLERGGCPVKETLSWLYLDLCVERGLHGEWPLGSSEQMLEAPSWYSEYMLHCIGGKKNRWWESDLTHGRGWSDWTQTQRVRVGLWVCLQTICLLSYVAEYETPWQRVLAGKREHTLRERTESSDWWTTAREQIGMLVVESFS